jgi:outer membrane protein assembly factor BamB
VESSPVVTGGLVYVGSDDQSVYAFDELTGARVWSYRTGGMVQSSPAVSGGMLFVGSEDGNVYALNATTGKLVWKRATGAGVHSSPNVSNGIVYLGSRTGVLSALHASDGTVAWTYTTGGPITSSPAVFTERTGKVSVFFGSGDTNLYSLDAAKGTKLWSYKTGGAVESSPAVANWNGGDILVFGSDDLKFYGLDADTGQRKWVCATNGIAISSPSLNVALGRAYWGTNGWDVQGHNLIDGLTQWSYTCGAAVRTSPAVANGLVYGTCGRDQHIYALREQLKLGAGPHGASPSNRVHRMVWNYDTGAPIESSPAVVDGMVFTGSDAGLFAFALP